MAAVTLCSLAEGQMFLAANFALPTLFLEDSTPQPFCLKVVRSWQNHEGEHFKQGRLRRCHFLTAAVGEKAATYTYTA